MDPDAPNGHVPRLATAPESGLWTSVDPGETLGWAIWRNRELLGAGQDRMWTFIDGWLDPDAATITRLVVEDWALYPWELKNLGWNKCRTARCIGALELIARIRKIDFVLQPAAIKERAEAAGAEALFLSPRHENRHANDAIRHGVYFLEAGLGRDVGR